jgi:hypothetical protein
MSLFITYKVKNVYYQTDHIGAEFSALIAFTGNLLEYLMISVHLFDFGLFWFLFLFFVSFQFGTYCVYFLFLGFYLWIVKWLN